MRLIRANIEIDVENAATAEKLMKSGFEPLEGVTKVAPSDPDKTKKNLDEMTGEELKAIAKEKGLSGVSALAKKDRLEILKE